MLLDKENYNKKIMKYHRQKEKLLKFHRYFKIFSIMHLPSIARELKQWLCGCV